MPKKLAPIPPGEFLVEEFMKPSGLNANRLATALHIPPNRIGDIIRGRRSITADTALRLARYFGTSASLWMNIQSRYELECAEDEIASEIERKVRPIKKTA